MYLTDFGPDLETRYWMLYLVKFAAMTDPKIRMLFADDLDSHGSQKSQWLFPSNWYPIIIQGT